MRQEPLCCVYDKEFGTCVSSFRREHLYTCRRPGTDCPFEGSVQKCNEWLRGIQFTSEQQVIAYILYGIVSEDEIPFSELCLEEHTAGGALLQGTRVHYQDGSIWEIQKDGSLEEIL